MLGGPIQKDQLWFFGGARHQGNRKLVSGMFNNVNAGDPTKWTYVADPTQHVAATTARGRAHTLRLTWQATPRNKFSFFWDRQSTCTSCISRRQRDDVARGGGHRRRHSAARAAGDVDVAGDEQAAARSRRRDVPHDMGRPGARLANPTHDLIRVAEQCTAGCAANGGIAGLTYRSTNWASDYNGRRGAGTRRRRTSPARTT